MMEGYEGDGRGIIPKYSLHCRNKKYKAPKVQKDELSQVSVNPRASSDFPRLFSR